MYMMPNSPRKRLAIRDYREERPDSGDESPSSYHACSSSSKALVAKNHCCKLLKGLQEFYKQDTFCDYVLRAEGQEIKVHRVVLASCSDYFKVMLTGKMKESREGHVELKGVSASGLKVVVDFAYTGMLQLTNDNCEEVLAAATHLQVSNAVELCSRYIEASITVDNCVDILNLAEMYSLVATETKAKEFMLENFELVSKSSQYHNLTHFQLSSLLGENGLKILSEFHLFELVLEWIQYNYGEREQHVAELMKNVRLPLLSGEELVEKVSTVPLMRENRECNDLLTEAKDYHIVVSKQPLLQTRRTQVRSDINCVVMCHRENLEYYNFNNKHHGFLRDSTIQLYHPAVTVVDNFMYACGGKYDCNENEIATARCFRYDPRFDSWYELTSMNEARMDFVLLACDGKLYAISGQDEHCVIVTMEAFDIATNEWEEKTSMNYSVYGHAGAVHQGKLYVSGGQKFDGCCNDLECFEPETDLWEKRCPMTHPRMNHNMVTMNDRIYVMCGNIEDGYGFPVPVIAIEYYTPANDQWTICQKTLNIREAGASVFEDKIYIVGGINGEHYFSDLVQCYVPSKDEVSIVEKFPTRLHGRACCILTLPQYV